MGSTRAPAAWVLQTGIESPKRPNSVFSEGAENHTRGRVCSPASPLPPQQVPRGDEGLEAGHFDGRIDAGAPEQAAVLVLDLDIGRGAGIRAAAHGV